MRGFDPVGSSLVAPVVGSWLDGVSAVASLFVFDALETFDAVDSLFVFGGVDTYLLVATLSCSVVCLLMVLPREIHTTYRLNTMSLYRVMFQKLTR